MAAHVFISYVREDADAVERLARDLEALDVEVWLDRKRLEPGVRWRDAIYTAIRSGVLFVACFSENVVARERSHMNEELTLAIDELRSRPTDRSWFIPVRLDDSEVPARAISASETLRDLQWVDLADDWYRGVNGIAKLAVQHRKASSYTSRVDILATLPRPHDSVAERNRRIDPERKDAQEIDPRNYSDEDDQAGRTGREGYEKRLKKALPLQMNADTWRETWGISVTWYISTTDETEDEHLSYAEAQRLFAYLKANSRQEELAILGKAFRDLSLIING